MFEPGTFYHPKNHNSLNLDPPYHWSVETDPRSRSGSATLYSYLDPYPDNYNCLDQDMQHYSSLDPDSDNYDSLDQEKTQLNYSRLLNFFKLGNNSSQIINASNKNLSVMTKKNRQILSKNCHGKKGEQRRQILVFRFLPY